MAKLYGNIASSALMTFDKSFARANGQPLDSTEVYYSLAAAEEYAAGAGAYIGQKIVVIENGKITHYSIEDEAGTLKELGAKPVGDSKTVSVAADGKISLANIPETLKDEEGNDIPATYNAVLVNGVLTWVKPSATTVEGLSDLIEALTGRVDTAEADIDKLETAVGVAAKPETTEGAGDAVAATGLFKAIDDEVARATAAEEALDGRITTLEGKEDKDTTYSVKEGEKVLSLDGTAFGTTLKIDYSDNKIKLLGIGDEVISEFDASAFTVDGVLEDASYDATAKTITFKWNIVTGEDENGDPVYKTDVVEIGDLVDTYTAGNGISIENNVVSAKVLETDKYLTVDETGIHTKGIDDAISAAEGHAATDAQGKADAAKEAAIADADGKLANKADKATTLAGYGITDAYTATQTDAAILAKIGEMTGGESAADVLALLNSYKASNDREVWGDTFVNENIVDGKYDPKSYPADSRIDALEKVGAQANVLESVVAKDTAKLSVSGIVNKTITIDDSALVALINAAQAQADKCVQDASNAQTTANEAKAKADANETALGTLTTTVTGHGTTIGEHGTKIGNLETLTEGHTSSINSNTQSITTLTGQVATKAEQTALDGAVADIAKNTTAITTLNETTIPGINTEIGKKANSADVYTKTEIGTIAEGKTLVKMIEDAQTAATYDDTQVKADIKTNTDAIAKLNGSATEEGSVAKIADDRIAAALAGADADFDTLKEMSDWLSEHSDSAAAMNSDIAALKAVTAGIGGTDEPATVIALVDGKIAAAAPVLANLVKAEDGSATATTGLITPENGKFEMADGKVTAVSTDLLTQGTNTLVLNGGSATA